MKENILFSKIALFRSSVQALAQHLGISRQALVMKLEGKSQFKQDEIKSIATYYKLTPEEVYEIFLAEDEEEDV